MAGMSFGGAMQARLGLAQDTHKRNWFNSDTARRDVENRYDLGLRSNAVNQQNADTDRMGTESQVAHTNAMSPLLQNQQLLANNMSALQNTQAMRLDPLHSKAVGWMDSKPVEDIGQYFLPTDIGMKDGGIIERIGDMLGVRRTPQPQSQPQTDKVNQAANMLGGQAGQAADTIRSRGRNIEDELRRQGFRKGKTKVVDKTGKGSPRKDTVPAKLAEGEAVLNTGAAELLGRDKIEALNQQGLRKMGVPGKPGAVVKGGTMHASKGLVDIGPIELQLAENEYAEHVMAQRAANAQQAMREAQMLQSPNNVPYQDNVRMPKAAPNFRTGAPAVSMPAVYREDPLKTKYVDEQIKRERAKLFEKAAQAKEGANLRGQADKINEYYRAQAQEASKTQARALSRLDKGARVAGKYTGKALNAVPRGGLLGKASIAAAPLVGAGDYTPRDESLPWYSPTRALGAVLDTGSGVASAADFIPNLVGANLGLRDKYVNYVDNLAMPDNMSFVEDDYKGKRVKDYFRRADAANGQSASAPMTTGDAKLLARETDAAADGKQVPVPAGYKPPEERDAIAAKKQYEEARKKQAGLRGAMALLSMASAGGNQQAGLTLKNLLDKDASEATAEANAVNKALLSRQKAMDDLANIGKGKFFTTHPKTGAKTENGEMGDQYATVFRRLMEKRGIDPEVAMNDQATRNSLEKEAKLQLLLGQYTSENSGSNLKTGVRDQVGKIKNMSFWGGGDGNYSRWDAMFDGGGIKLEDGSVVPIDWLLKNGAERQTIDRLLAGLKEEE